MSAEPTRRVMLRAAASGLLLAGCKGVSVLGPLPKLTADVVTLDHAIAAEELMVARYELAVSEAATFATPTTRSGQARLTTLLSELLAEHRAHLTALRSRLVLPPRLATAKPRPSPVPPALPADRHGLLAELAAAERAACASLMTQLLDVPPALAQLMASIGASEATHVVVLTRTRLA